MLNAKKSFNKRIKVYFAIKILIFLIVNAVALVNKGKIIVLNVLRIAKNAFHTVH